MPPSQSRRARPTRALGARSLWIAGTCLLLPATPAGSESIPDLGSLDAALEEVQLLLAEAHFVTMIGVAESTSRWAQELPETDAVLTRRARLEVLIATAQIALGRDDLAAENLRVAVALDPELRLAEQTTPPKLTRLFRELHPRASLEAAEEREPWHEDQEEKTEVETREGGSLQ